MTDTPAGRHEPVGGLRYRAPTEHLFTEEPLMPTWPPGCLEDWDDPTALTRVYRAEAAHELARLEGERAAHRQARWLITVLVIAALALSTRLVAGGFDERLWGLIAFIAGFTLLAMHQMVRHDVSRVRGRELDADIAAATNRLREMENSA